MYSLCLAEPTQSELFGVVDNLFCDADKETVTVKDIVRAVADHFNLTKVEKSMKKIIKSRLTDLMIVGERSGPSHGYRCN